MINAIKKHDYYFFEFHICTIKLGIFGDCKINPRAIEGLLKIVNYFVKVDIAAFASLFLAM